MSYGQQVEAYRNASIVGSTPEQLILVLYERALDLPQIACSRISYSGLTQLFVPWREHPAGHRVERGAAISVERRTIITQNSKGTFG